MCGQVGCKGPARREAISAMWGCARLCRAAILIVSVRPLMCAFISLSDPCNPISCNNWRNSVLDILFIVFLLHDVFLFPILSRSAGPCRTCSCRLFNRILSCSVLLCKNRNMWLILLFLCSKMYRHNCDELVDQIFFAVWISKLFLHVIKRS